MRLAPVDGRTCLVHKSTLARASLPLRVRRNISAHHLGLVNHTYYIPKRSTTNVAAATRSPSLAEETDAIAFCLDSAVADTSYLTISIAYNAAQELWPDRVVGPVALYVNLARSILPVLAEPHHAVVLVRLLCDEGVIGARSTAGREGPVVGRAVRHSGSRPLLAAEIAEHWPTILDSCLLRWSLEGRNQAEGRGWGRRGEGGGGCGREELLGRAQVAFRRAQAALIADEAAVAACMERVTPHVTIVEALKGCTRPSLLLTSSLPAVLATHVLERCNLHQLKPQSALGTVFTEHGWKDGIARLVQRAAAGGSRVQLVTGNLARLEQLVEGPWEEGPLEAEGDAGQGERWTLPEPVEAAATREPLEAPPGEGKAGTRALATPGEPDVGSAGHTSSSCYSHAQEVAVSGGYDTQFSSLPQPSGRPDTDAASRVRDPEFIGSEEGAGLDVHAYATAAASHAFAAAEDAVRAVRTATAAPPPPQPQAAAAASSHETTQSVAVAASDSPATKQRLWETLRMVHLAEWSCTSMSFRARALSYKPRASLLTEPQMAEWLGVTHLDVVMDGVAWR